VTRMPTLLQRQRSEGVTSLPLDPADDTGTATPGTGLLRSESWDTS
jgi:hypothetical protein